RNSLHQQFGRFGSELMLRQFDGSQFWPKNSKPGIIVEADQTEIFGTGQAQFFGCFQEAHGHEVICAVNAVRSLRQEGVSGTESGVHSIVALNHKLFIKRQAFRLESVAKALPACLCITYFQWTADQANASSARTGKVPNCIVSALVIVSDYRVLGQ